MGYRIRYGNMKGIAFTLDALFALILSVTAISILLYFQFYSQAPSQIRYNDAQNFMQELLSVNASSIHAPIAQQLLYSNPNLSWSSYGGGRYGSFSLNSGEVLNPFASYILTLPSSSSSNMVLGNNNLYIGYGSSVEAVSALTGRTVWTINSGTPASSLSLANSVLFYSNSTYVTAVSAVSGLRVWQSPLINGSDVTPLEAYGNKIVYGTASALLALYQNNGTIAWKSIYAPSANNAQILNTGYGTLAASTSSGIGVYDSVFSSNTLAGVCLTAPVNSNIALYIFEFPFRNIYPDPENVAILRLGRICCPL